MKRVIISIFILLAICTTFALCEPELELAKYTVPATIRANSIKEFYGVWKGKYVSIDGRVFTIDSYLDYFMYINYPDTYKKESHISYYIFDGEYEANTIDDTFVVEPFDSKFENGKIKYTNDDGISGTVELLADGYLCDSSVVEGVDIKFIMVRESLFSTFFQNKWIRINTETGISYDEYVASLPSQDAQNKQTNEEIHLVDDPQSISLYLTGKTEMFGSNTVNIEYVIVNNTNTTLDLTFDSIVINGWEVNETLSGLYNLRSKNKKKGNLTIFLSDADLTSMSEIKEMVLNFHIADSDKYKILNRFGPITLRFDGKNWTKIK